MNQNWNNMQNGRWRRIANSFYILNNSSVLWLSLKLPQTYTSMVKGLIHQSVAVHANTLLTDENLNIQPLKTRGRNFIDTPDMGKNTTDESLSLRKAGTEEMHNC